MVFKLTLATTDDHILVDTRIQRLTGKLFGDRGYIERFSTNCANEDCSLSLGFKKNMKHRCLFWINSYYISEQSLNRLIINLKASVTFEHSRHRSINNFMVNLLAGLISIIAGLATYALQTKKPSLNLNQTPLIFS